MYIFYKFIIIIINKYCNITTLICIQFFFVFVFRYHFFLQLKLDVIEGHIVCDADQAVLLASYSMQGIKIKKKSTNI